jgi:2-dehydropantoate 2-reductase
MRILVVGAGAIGGYLGACLVRAGRDVTFLVRPARAAKLAKGALRVSGASGSFSVPARTILADAIAEPFDVILFAVKSYAADEAIAQFAPAVGANSAVIPMLNGMRHMQSLSARFGADRVLGGSAMFSANLDPDGGVVLNTPNPYITFGEQAGGPSQRVAAIASVLTAEGFETRQSEAAMLDMWEKWAAIAAIGFELLSRRPICSAGLGVPQCGALQPALSLKRASASCCQHLAATKFTTRTVCPSWSPSRTFGGSPAI